MGKGTNLQVGASNGVVASPTPGSDKLKAQESPTASAAKKIAKQANLPDTAMASKTSQTLRLLIVERLIDFPAVVKLCQALAIMHIKAKKALDHPKANGFSDAKVEELKHLLVPANDPDNALTQLFIAKKSGELPNAAGLLNQMRKVLTWQALQDPNNKNAIRKIIGHLNKKMGCTPQNGSAWAPVKTIADTMCKTVQSIFRKTTQNNVRTSSQTNLTILKKHAWLKLFNDLMTQQGTHTQSETVAVLFHACPPQNLKNLQKAFERAAAQYAKNTTNRSIFSNMSQCLTLAIQKFRNHFKHTMYRKTHSRFKYRAKKNPDIVMAIVTSRGSYLEHASDDLKKNPEIVKVAVRQSWRAIQYVDSTVENYKEIVLDVISRNIEAFQFVNPITKKLW